ncbi:transmembrane protein 39A isoform X1 [Pithys albifrons albifrons]|uniref:transmembrane protein 39A isoform X1 n=1 Tax=Pithys albifrons albifrons TaxID=3385563 RepID=UPI003A5CB8F9
MILLLQELWLCSCTLQTFIKSTECAYLLSSNSQRLEVACILKRTISPAYLWKFPPCTSSNLGRLLDHCLGLRAQPAGGTGSGLVPGHARWKEGTQPATAKPFSFAFSPDAGWWELWKRYWFEKQASQVGATSVIHYMVRLVLLTLCGWVLCWTLVNLFRSHSVLNLLFLGYPFGVYVPLCCFHQDSRAQPLPSDCGYLVQDQVADDGASAVSSLVKDFFSLLWESLREQFNNPTSIPTHSCPLSPDLIRNEVECLKADFNRRIKEVLFNSLFSAYYVAFLPLCFVKSTQYYDMRWSCEHLIMVWINAFVMLTTQLLPPKYCDLLHRSAAHLGKWQKLEHGSYSNAPQHIWSENTIWPQGVLVRRSRCLYKAVGPYNVAVPSDVSHARFYFLFHRPLRLLNLLIFIEGSVVCYQLYSLLRSEKWNHTLSMALILFCNYYVLFKLLRDRIVLGRAYSYPLNNYGLKAH